jgi:predicted PhzF superfamily epimerase YddE/YHI9
MFAPVFGIPEDPCTGGASAPLGAYLLKYNVVSADTASRLVSLQGVRMGRPSRIHIALSSRVGVLERFGRRRGGDRRQGNDPRIAGRLLYAVPVIAL